MMKARERRYDIPNLNDIFYYFVLNKFKDSSVSLRPKRTEIGVEIPYMKRNFDSGYCAIEDGIYFEVQVSVDRELNKEDLGNLVSEISKSRSEFLGRVIASYFNDETEKLFLDVKREILDIPLGKMGHLSGNLNDDVLKKIIHPLDLYLDSKQ